MSDRVAEARAEAERRWHDRLERLERWPWFLDGVVWADASPKPHTITRASLRDTAMMLAHTRQDEIEAMLPGLLGIEVEDHE